MNKNGLKAYIPRFQVLQRGAIRGLSKEVDATKLVKEINELNSVSTEKLMRKVKEEGKTNWANGRVHQLDFRKNAMPEKIYMIRARNEVALREDHALRCFQCGKFSNFLKFCNKEKKHLNCGESYPIDNPEKCLKVLECINGQLNHYILSSRCPEFGKANDIQKTMATEM